MHEALLMRQVMSLVASAVMSLVVSDVTSLAQFSEAHLKALTSASLQLTPVLELFFCSDAYVDAFWCAWLYSGGVVFLSALWCGWPSCPQISLNSKPALKNNVRRRGALRTLGCVSLMLIISGLPLFLLPVLQARAGSRPSCMFLRWICILSPD